LGNTVKPLHITNCITEPSHDDYYLARVHIQDRLETSRGMRTRSAYDSTMPPCYLHYLHQQHHQEGFVVPLLHSLPGAKHHQLSLPSSPYQ
jgi:hypothetical protein